MVATQSRNQTSNADPKRIDVSSRFDRYRRLRLAECHKRDQGSHKDTCEPDSAKSVQQSHLAKLSDGKFKSNDFAERARQR